MSMSLKSHFDMFAKYNQWANERLYSAASTLRDQDYRMDCGAFFKSIHGTLNHLLVTDRIWLQSLAQKPHRLAARKSGQHVVIQGSFIQNVSQPALSLGFSAGLLARLCDTFAVFGLTVSGLSAGSCNLNT